MSIFKKMSFEEEIIQYMGKKYGKDFLETFKILGIGGQSMFAKSLEASAISERFPEEVIRILKNKRNGKINIKDNYIEICRREEISQAYADLLKGIYSKYSVKLHAMNRIIAYTPEDIDMNTPVEQIIRHKKLNGAVIYIRVEDDPDKKEECLEAITDKVLKNIGSLKVNIAYFKDINDISTKYLSVFVYINKEFELSQVSWNEF